MNELRPSRLCGRTQRNQHSSDLRLNRRIGCKKNATKRGTNLFPMVEATGESIYRTVLATKCSILPRHLLSIIMASFALHWVLVPRIHANQISREKTYWKTRRPWGRGSLPIGPRAHPVIKIGSGQIVGARESPKRAGKKGCKEKERTGRRARSLCFFAPFFSPVWDFPLPPLSAPGSPKMAPGAAGFYFVIKFSGRKQGYNTKETFPVFIYLFTFLSSTQGFPGAIEGWKIKLTRT